MSDIAERGRPKDLTLNRREVWHSASTTRVSNTYSELHVGESFEYQIEKDPSVLRIAKSKILDHMARLIFGGAEDIGV